jgi:hypothetical protein
MAKNKTAEGATRAKHLFKHPNKVISGEQTIEILPLGSRSGMLVGLNYAVLQTYRQLDMTEYRNTQGWFDIRSVRGQDMPYVVHVDSATEKYVSEITEEELLSAGVDIVNGAYHVEKVTPSLYSTVGGAVRAMINGKNTMGRPRLIESSRISDGSELGDSDFRVVVYKFHAERVTMGVAERVTMGVAERV